MPISLTNDMMRQIIMDHYSNPENRKTPGESYEKIHMHSDNCIDDLNIYLRVENDLVTDACFDGVACTISTASTDIMCNLLKNQNIEKAKYIINQYLNMIHEEPFDDEVLDEAVVFVNTSKQAARIRCATIGWNGANEILKDK